MSDVAKWTIGIQRDNTLLYQREHIDTWQTALAEAATLPRLADDALFVRRADAPALDLDKRRALITPATQEERQAAISAHAWALQVMYHGQKQAEKRGLFVPEADGMTALTQEDRGPSRVNLFDRRKRGA